MRKWISFCLILIFLSLISCARGLNNNLAENNPRDINHAMGRTRVPQNPSRVITLTNEATEAALILDIQPIGAVTGIDTDTFYPHLKNQMLGVIPIGKEGDIDVETIRGLKPDLILGSKSIYEGLYNELSTIAPTVFTDNVSGYIRDNFSLYSRALHKEDFGTQVIVNYNSHAQRARMGLNNFRNKTIAIIGFFEEKAYLYLKGSFIGNIFSEIELAIYEHNKQSNNQEYVEITYRDFIEIANNAEILLYFVNEDSHSIRNEWFNDPLIRNLTGTLEEIYEIDEDVFFHGNGIIAAKLVLETMEDLQAKRR